MTQRLVLLAVAACSLLQGCDSDDDAEKQFGAGTLVVNEGGLGKNNASITFYDPVSETAEQNIFKNAGGKFAGDVLQSVTVHGEEAYLVLNGSSAIEVADANTFRSIRRLTAPALVMPRYVKVIDGEAFVSVWGPYDENYSLIDSYVLVLDAGTSEVLDTIDTDEGVENFVYHGGRLFASNYNYGASSTLAVIDPANHTLIDQVVLAPGPAGAVIDANGKLWVITTGTYQGNDGKLFRIDPVTLEIEDEIELNINPGTDLAVTADGEHLLYHGGNNVYQVAIDATTAPEPFVVVPAETPYSLGVDPGNGDIYFGDALNYTTVGKVYIYGADGTAKGSFDAGISPGQFIFK